MRTLEELKAIKALQKEVEAHDHLEMKLNWEMLEDRESNEYDFLHYENDELVAFLGLYGFGSTVEVTGMVKPNSRREGHFTRLFDEVMSTVSKLGFTKILMNAPASSEAAKAFLQMKGAIYSFTEHQMQWQPVELPEATGFTLRPAEDRDRELRVQLDIKAFGLTREDSLATEGRITAEPDTDLWMIEVEGEPVGKVRVKREEGQAWIYGFAILPEHQGKGIGRNVLRRVVKDQSEGGYSVHLEVEATNAHALRLYESVGFKVHHAQDYYTYSLNS